MPRPRKPGAPEPKRRSRKGCWPCKARKVKCGEEKPSCVNCLRQGETCDYSIRLNWEGRTKKTASAGLLDSRHSGYTSEIRLSQSRDSGVASIGPLSGVQPQESSVQGSSPERSIRSGVAWDYSRCLEILQDSAPLPPVVLEDNYISYNHDSKHNANVDAAIPPPQPPAPVSASPRLAESPRAVLPEQKFLEDDTHLDRAVRCIKSSPYYFPCEATNYQLHDVSRIESPGSAGDTLPALTSDMHMHPHIRWHISVSPTVSTNSEDVNTRVINKSVASLNGALNVRRVSINSLLSTELNEELDHMLGSSTAGSKRFPCLESDTFDYGLDCGHPDLDLNRNDDAKAIQSCPFLDQTDMHWRTKLELISPEAISDIEEVPRNDYYAKPVPIKIPKPLTPLPSTLLENPINLMYFHHFLNHTARILVPHDCLENPFLSVMPSMAIEDPNLLNLMLAYSASHRARYLRHPEPASRIAHWVSDVFPSLRHALHDPHENIADSHLATAIMLLSLKIISPSTFEVPIPWQSHLKLARDLFLARGEQDLAHPGNRIAFFLARWLAYLDILGGLSCPHSDPPLFEGRYWSVTSPGSPPHEDDEFRVDCFSGYTPRTGSQLARVGELTHRCDNERFDKLGNFCPGWTPSPDAVLAAEALLQEMSGSRLRGYAKGTHHTEQENYQMIAVDQAFHWAGVLHLHRRVLDTPPSAPAVQEALCELMSALAHVRAGSTAEVCMLFPLFTAGCEAQDPQQRLEIMERVKSFEGVGLKQIQNARKLMQRCWDEDLPWIALARGEFLG